MVRDGYFYGLGLIAVAVVLWLLTGSHLLPVVPVLLAFFFLWFFRDPNRKIPTAPGLIVSPADGKVTETSWIETPQGTRLKISVFLNVFNVHVNRSPEKGVVRMVQYRKGLFMNAMRTESALMNEQNLVVIDCGQFEIAVKQIAGLLARRIVCWAKEGDVLERGQRFGLIKFGSRVDLLLPSEARLVVKRGDHVVGGRSILAELPETSPAVAE